MKIDTILKNFRAMGQQDGSSFADTADFLHESLIFEKGKIVNAVNLLMAKENTATVEIFNTLLDLLTIEPIFDIPKEVSSWRSFVISLGVKRPSYLMVFTISNTEPLRAELAEHLGLTKEDIHIEPYFYSTEDTFEMPPSEVFTMCSNVKTCAETSVALATALNIECSKNEWDGSRKCELVEDELCLFISIKCALEEGTTILNELRQLIGCNLDNPLRIKPINGKEEKLSAEVLLVGAPWSTSKDALYLLNVRQTYKALMWIFEKYPKNIKKIKLTSVIEDDMHPSIRLSVIAEDDSLLAGIYLMYISKPEIFIDKLNPMLADLAIPPVEYDKNTYFAKKVDSRYYPFYRFLTPNNGWQTPQKCFDFFMDVENALN